MAKYYSEFDWWCIHATKKIKYRPDRQEVFNELHQHMEDRYQDFLDQGMNKDDARKMTLHVMGDADELSPQLAAIHKPFWGYLYSSFKWVFVILAIVTLLKFIPWWKSYQYEMQSFFVRSFDLPISLDPFEDDTYEVKNPDGIIIHPWIRIFHAQPNCKATYDDFTFSIKNVVLWQEQPYIFQTSTTQDHLYIQMDITNPFPWIEFGDAPKWFWAEDSSGKYYYSNNEYASRKYAEAERANPEPSLIGVMDQTDLFTYTYYIWVRGIDCSNTEGITLHYDRDGRKIELPIDLTGGDVP